MEVDGSSISNAHLSLDSDIFLRLGVMSIWAYGSHVFVIRELQIDFRKIRIIKIDNLHLECYTWKTSSSNE